MFPMNLGETGIDFLATGTYKWLLAGYGVAPFFVAESFWTGSGRIGWERSRSKRSSGTTGIGFIRELGCSSMPRSHSTRCTNWDRRSTTWLKWGSSGSENIRSPWLSNSGAD